MRLPSFAYLSAFALLLSSGALSHAQVRPVVFDKEITLSGKKLKYTARAGSLPVKDSRGEVAANIGYFAYSVEGAGRPVLFAFNGGPGAASLYFHLGTLGPKRVDFEDSVDFPKPPYTYSDNQDSWLPFTDLVLIDPVGTGFSRVTSPGKELEFQGDQNDIRSVGDFIATYVDSYALWNRPLFVIGSSYGGLRAAGLSKYLFDRSVCLRGVLLLSPSSSSHDYTPYEEIQDLPTFTAIAWFHKRLSPRLQMNLEATLDEVKKFAIGDYWKAIRLGKSMNADEYILVERRLSEYTGLSLEQIQTLGLRPYHGFFREQLLLEQKLSVGGPDGRKTGYKTDAASNFTIPFLAAFKQYLHEDLHMDSVSDYSARAQFTDWKFDKYSSLWDLTEVLRANPYFHVFVASGYYDMNIPFFGVQLVFENMDVLPKARKNVELHQYRSGHTLYFDPETRKSLREDARKFIEKAANPK